MAERQAIELPLEDCAIRVTVGSDGTWIHLESRSGKSCSFHVANALGVGPGIIAWAAREWCCDREDDAEQINKDNGQFGVGA
jgi:hypothetical protein